MSESALRKSYIQNNLCNTFTIAWFMMSKVRKASSVRTTDTFREHHYIDDPKHTEKLRKREWQRFFNHLEMNEILVGFGLFA